MRDVIEWLAGVEQLASDVYRRAAEEFAGNAGFAEFLARLARDESKHHDLMSGILRRMAQSDLALPNDIQTGPAFRERIEAPLRDALDALAAHRMTEAQMIARTVDLEFSEWNDLFLYVVNAARQAGKEGQTAAATFQAHEDRVRRFLEGLPPEMHPSRSARDLPDVWQRRVLVVDDSVLLANLFQEFLAHRSIPSDTAADDRAGLERLRAERYDLVLSDVDMPVMGGWDFYHRAVEEDPAMKWRFLFWSAGLTPALRDMFSEAGLLCLPKPLDPDFLMEEVEQRLRSLSEEL